MEFKKDDENYIYEVISKNIKKYRRQKGWTQEKLAEEINYSLSFISGIESSYHQTFSLGAAWRIAQALDVNFDKLCEDDEHQTKKKYILFKCDTCQKETKIPLQMINIYKELNSSEKKGNLPSFDCLEECCQGHLHPVNPTDI